MAGPITRQHADHFLPSLIAGRLATRPRLPIWNNKDVAALLEGSGATVHVIGDGDAYTDPHTRALHQVRVRDRLHPAGRAEAGIPVHDLGLDATGLAALASPEPDTPFAPGTGSPFVRLPQGTPIKV